MVLARCQCRFWLHEAIPNIDPLPFRLIQNIFCMTNELTQHIPYRVPGSSGRYWFSTVDRRCRPMGPAIDSAIEEAILDGRLQPGQILPPQRLTADLMGLHVNTVNRAMHEAAERGLVHATSRQSTVVVGTRKLLAGASRGYERLEADLPTIRAWGGPC
jgi:GntR family transcriptional regulator